MSSISEEAAYRAVVDYPAFHKLKAYDNAHRYAREWYRVIPNCHTPAFPGFMYSSVELAIEVCGMKDVQLEIGGVATAAADKELGRIIIAPHTLLTSAIEKRGFRVWEETEIMVAATNGMIIHEAMHLKESETDLRQAAATIRDRHGAIRLDGPLFYAFLNIVEDVFIEWEAKERFPAFVPFLETAHEFWLSKNEMERRLKEFIGSRDMIEETYGAGEFIDLLIALKNWQLAEAPIWKGILKEYNDELKTFRSAAKISRRLELAHELWETITSDRRLRWDMAPSFSSKLGRDGRPRSFDEGGIMITVDEGMLKELEAEAKKHRAGSEEADILRNVKRELEKRNIVIRIVKEQTQLSKIPEMQVQVIEESSTQLKPDPRFISLAKKLRSSLTQNYAPGQPLRKGPKLVSTRLQRIVTDGKIFTYPEVRKRTGRDYEVIILVDCSGSMSGGHPNKILEAMKVGLAAWVSMKGARIRTCLLGHTSNGFRSSGDEIPLLYVFGLAKDPIGRVAKRAYRVAHGSGILFNNYDGFAVKKACEYFSERPTKKWLIVISDGQPSGRNYSGNEANAHTRIEANKARAKGIDVVSITIEDGAYEVNDAIYGKGKNTHTKSSKVLLDLVEAMFTKHKGEGNGKA